MPHAVPSQATTSRSSNTDPGEPIAIVGIGCRFPGGAHDADLFWQLLAAGVDGICEVPADRWDPRSFYHPDPRAPGKSGTRRGGYLRQGIEEFDARFFGISPREAAWLDPQQRLLLEVAWEAFEDAGVAPERLAGGDVGVFTGGLMVDASGIQMGYLNRRQIGQHAATGASLTMLSARLSYFFDLRGPSISIDTACSSSLVAAHYACASLRNGECSTALVAGVNMMFNPSVMVSLTKGGFLAPDGRCKAFDVRADGYGRAEGAGVVVLKPLAAARRDRDRVYAVILGSAVNQDGRSEGITQPSQPAQEALLREAYARAGVAPSRARYIEAHGTGTPVGDPVEAAAIAAVLGEGRGPDRPCLVGSVKTNLGHMEGAAGVGGLIKTALALFHRQVPAHLHLTEVSPAIRFAEHNLRIPTSLEPWPSGEDEAIASVNSFGYGGTNAHAVLREAQLAATADDDGTHDNDDNALAPVGDERLVPISARDPEALKDYARALADLVDSPDRTGGATLDDIVYSAGERRSHHEQRAALVVRSREELAARLRAFADGEDVPSLCGGRAGRARPTVVFVYTGMGPQWWAMGRELHRAEPVFRAALEELDLAMRAHGPTSPLEELLADEDRSRIHETLVAQTTNVLIQAALTRLWRSWGVVPDAIVGHSAGELAAALAAGALTVEDGARLAHCRATQHASRTGAGRMLAVELGREEIERLLSAHPEVCVAAINAPRSVTLSGPAPAIEAVAALLEARGVWSRVLQGSVPYHSHLMDPIERDFVAGLAGVAPRAPELPLYSTVTGERVTGADLDAGYWWRNTRQPVQFDAAIGRILDDHPGQVLFVEIGPHPVLAAAIAACVSARGRSGAALPSLHRKRRERETMLAALGRLHVEGFPVDFSRQRRPRARFVRLPSYPWQRERHWFESPESRVDRLGPDGHPLLGRRLPAAIPTWEAELNPNLLPYLVDHKVQGEVVLPGAAYVEIALALHRELFEDTACTLEDLEFHGALVVDLAEGTRLRASFDPPTGRFTIHSHQPGDERSFRLHASGRILAQACAPLRPRLDLAELRARCDQEVLRSAIYPALAQRGLDYGPWFRGVRRMWHDGVGGTLARVDLGHALEGLQAHHLLHPGLLDACFQSLMAARALGPAGDDHTYLPVGIDEIRLRAAPRGEVWAHGRLVAGDDLEVRSELSLCDARGEVLVELRGLRAQAMTAGLPATPPGPYDDWFYELKWDARPLPPLAPLARAGRAGEPGSAAAAQAPWLLFSDGPGATDLTAAALERAGLAVLRVTGGDGYAELPGGCQVRFDHREDLSRAVATLAGRAGQLAGALYIASLDRPDPDVGEEATGMAGCARVMHVVQALAEAGLTPPPRLWIATSGAYRVRPGDALEGFSQAPLWAVGRVSNIELAQLRCAMIDLDPVDPLGSTQLAGLVAELLAATEETEVALRGESRFVARIERVAPSSVQRKQWVAAPATPVSLAPPTQRGNLSTLGFTRATRRPPGPGEIELEVHAAGVAFKDVLKLRGLLGGKDLDGGFTGSRIGMECGGVVTAIGDDVTDLAVGDEVVGFAPGCFSSYVIARATDVCRKPRHLALDAVAAAGPYLTAYYALEKRAGLRAGERILIHSAATGVGLAALHLARRAGAEVLATAGSPEKRAYLATLGVRAAMDSRSLEFADEVMRETGGRGVDVVLNSQAGEALHKSLGVLAPHGRFVDLRYWGGAGRLELLPDRFPKNASLLGVDLDSMFAEEKEVTTALMREVLRLLDAGELPSLPTTTFPAAEAAAAFDHVGKPEHLGRILVTLRDQAVPVPRSGRPAFRGDASYLITGGLGGFGLAVAGWLVDHGARHLVLVGRSGATTDEAQAGVAALEARGAVVAVLKADVAREAEVARALARAQEDRPLRGVFHAASVFEGKFLLHTTAELLAAGMAPKVLGAWYLHQLTRDIELDHFVLFSSVAGTIGETGTAGYSAANTFLDALAHYRRGRGMPALSMGWGLIGDVGIGVKDQRLGAIIQASGHRPVEVGSLLDVFAEALVTQPGHLSVSDMDWVRWAQTHPLANGQPRLSRLIPDGAADGPSDANGAGTWREALLAADPQARIPLVIGRLGEQAARVLGLSADRIDIDQPLVDFGLDSLMASELAIRLERDTGVVIQVMSLLRRGTLRDLAGRMLEDIQPAAVPVIEAPASASKN